MNQQNKLAKMGLNKTGMGSAPLMGPEMVAGLKFMPKSSGESITTGDFERAEICFIQQVEPIGSVPLPSTLRGALQTGLQKLKGQNGEVFIDKLGERLCFERSGVRLYDTFLRKCVALNVDATQMEKLLHFRNEELDHFKLIHQCMEKLGADPTGQTPFADTNAVMYSGIMQVLSDPRTSLSQSLQALLLAELGDREEWELLTKFARELGEGEMAEKFNRALLEETVHLQEIRRWNEEILL